MFIITAFIILLQVSLQSTFEIYTQNLNKCKSGFFGFRKCSIELQKSDFFKNIQRYMNNQNNPFVKLYNVVVFSKVPKKLADALSNTTHEKFTIRKNFDLNEIVKQIKKIYNVRTFKDCKDSFYAVLLKKSDYENENIIENDKNWKNVFPKSSSNTSNVKNCRFVKFKNLLNIGFFSFIKRGKNEPKPQLSNEFLTKERNYFIMYEEDGHLIVKAINEGNVVNPETLDPVLSTKLYKFTVNDETLIDKVEEILDGGKEKIDELKGQAKNFFEGAKKRFFGFFD